ncbi:hypothetical protein [Nocardioides sp. SLBN-35]|uniref:hypothetical protein n=1 Tax=Nocardioides sp. SLBN-35 TaxID=2768445 RepID=UPI00114E1D02|nr:hypothetical protein [Nocardioides sp. SLBN-35]TQK70934.1 hypothetical protein FBY23_2720 [Nocardioides sp. SLBN-35]
MAALLVFAVFGLVFVAVIVLLVLGVSAGMKRAAERRQGLAGLAWAREWEYRPNDPGLVDRFTGAPFGSGHSRQAVNVLIGRHDGRPFTAFDYHHTTGSGDSTSRHVHSVLAINLGVQAPPLSVGPTTMVGRWISSLSGSDIEIGDPAFDAYFTVRSPVRDFAVDVLLSDVREVMQHHPNVAWRITGDSLLVIRAGEHTPAEVDAKLHLMDALLDRIPERVWERLRGEQAR